MANMRVTKHVDGVCYIDNNGARFGLWALEPRERVVNVSARSLLPVLRVGIRHTVAPNAIERILATSLAARSLVRSSISSARLMLCMRFWKMRA